MPHSPSFGKDHFRGTDSLKLLASLRELEARKCSKAESQCKKVTYTDGSYLQRPLGQAGGYEPGHVSVFLMLLFLFFKFYCDYHTFQFYINL